MYLQHSARVNTSEHDDSSCLKCSNPEAKSHLSTLDPLCHSVLDVAVSRETQRSLAYSVTPHKEKMREKLKP